jgi:hypothetical protein
VAVPSPDIAGVATAAVPEEIALALALELLALVTLELAVLEA